MARKVEGFTCCWWDLSPLGNAVLDVTLVDVNYLEVSSQVLGMFSIRLCIHGLDRLIHNPA